MTTATAAPAPEINKGMKGVVVAESSICFIDGAAGKLIYRGYAIEDLAENATYEEVAYLLLYDAVPTRAQLDEFKAKIGAEFHLPPQVIDIIRQMPKSSTPMAVLRTAVSALSEFDPDVEDLSVEAAHRMSIRLLAKIPCIVAAFARVRKGEAIVQARPDQCLSWNLLYCLNGKEPTETMVRATDLYLVLLAEHGYNASTFAAITTAGTRADFYSCVVSAIGTLKGPLHGGANRAAMEMIEKLPTPEAARKHVIDVLERKERIMGFGHRVYTAKDPRGACLYKWAVKLLQESGETNLLGVCQAIEEEMVARKGINYNVDFYSAPVLHVLGFKTDTFVDLFAISRMAGWGAHLIEFKSDPALMRPTAKYIGARDLTWKKLA